MAEALTKIELKSQLRTPVLSVDVGPQGPPGSGAAGPKGDKGDTGTTGEPGGGRILIQGSLTQIGNRTSWVHPGTALAANNPYQSQDPTVLSHDVLNYAYLVGEPGTLKNLQLATFDAPGMGESTTFTIWKNGSATALQVVLSDNTTSGIDTTHTVSVVRGDLIATKIVSTAGAQTYSGTMVLELDTSVAPVPAFLQQATINLTPTQIKNMIASPVQLIAAPGAGKMIVPISLSFIIRSAGHTAYTIAGTQDMRIKWNTNKEFDGILLSNNILHTAYDDILVWGGFVFEQNGAQTNNGISEVENQPLMLSQNSGATEYSVGDAPCQVQILYWIMPTV